MNLYVPPMDSTIVDVDRDGRVRMRDEDWTMPTLQERRAIIYAARDQMAALAELVEILERDADARRA
jgi:hypothetical protein